MKRLKPVYISILVLVVFTVALVIGMQSQWWILHGRKTPLDYNYNGRHEDEFGEEHSDEENHGSTQVSGGSTVQDALDLGILIEDIENVLDGTIDDRNVLIKDIVAERGLKFGMIKDNLNALISN